VLRIHLGENPGLGLARLAEIVGDLVSEHLPEAHATPARKRKPAVKKTKPKAAARRTAPAVKKSKPKAAPSRRVKSAAKKSSRKTKR
jgi:hypothetical protein